MNEAFIIIFLVVVCTTVATCLTQIVIKWILFLERVITNDAIMTELLKNRDFKFKGAEKWENELVKATNKTFRKKR